MEDKIDTNSAAIPMMDLIRELYRFNRTIVSADNRKMLARLSEFLDFNIHEYPSGTDYQTWPVPPQWDVKEAYLSDGEKVIASYDEHPLFLVPYSKSFDGWVTKDELLGHIRAGPNRPDDFIYDHRIAADHQRRLKDWGLSLPYNRVQALRKGKYYVKIDVSVSEGAALVGEYKLKGQEKDTFALLSHTCHPGQANDGLAGVVVGMEIMRRLSSRAGQNRFTYQLLAMPETFGSAYYLANNVSTFRDYIGALFLETPGAGTVLTRNLSRVGNLYIDAVLESVVAKIKNVPQNCLPFHRGLGNDELNFDWPGVGIPGLSLYWDGYDEYHTSADSPDLIEQEKLETIISVVIGLIDVLENDYVPTLTQEIPVYQTRYDLYIDAFKNRDSYLNATDVLFAIDGNKSLFEITYGKGIPFWPMQEYLEGFYRLGFIEKKPTGKAQFTRRQDQRIVAHDAPKGEIR